MVESKCEGDFHLSFHFIEDPIFFLLSPPEDLPLSHRIRDLCVLHWGKKDLSLFMDVPPFCRNHLLDPTSYVVYVVASY